MRVFVPIKKELVIYMDGDAGRYWQILFCILLIIGGAYFASAESAYVRANKIRLKAAADDGDKRAKRALYITDHFDKALTTILIGNNIMHLACSSLATVIAIDLLGEGNTIIATVVTTAVVFLFSEMLPKSFAKTQSEKLALGYSASLTALMKILTPVAFVFIKISDLFSRLFGGGQDDRMTEEELETIIDQVEDSGTLDEEQTDLLRNAVDFTKTPLEDIMTMREDIVGVDISMSQEEIFAVVRGTNFSRLLVYEGDVDHVVGILPVREYLRAYLRRGYVNLRRVMLIPEFAAPDAAIDDLFAAMSASKKQFVVVREGDRTVGIATIEDFLEELVGEIWDEDDEYDEDFIKLGGNYFEIVPSMKVREALSRIGHPLPTLAEQKKTLDAWLRSNLAGEPKEDEGFTYGRLAVMAGPVEDGALKSVIIRLCDDEDEAKEEIDK